MAEKTPTVRRGIQKQLTLDPLAAQALDDMCLGHKMQGRLVSQLVLTEMRVREDRQQRRAARATETAGVSEE